MRRVSRHEALSLAVGEIAAFTACALRDQHAGAIDTRRVELDELHVLQRQPRAPRHRVAVASAGVGRGTGLIDAPAPARRDYDHVGAEAMDRSVLETPCEQTTAGTVVVHQEVDRKIFDEEARLVLQALLVKRMQDGMAGPVSGRAGPISDVAPGIIGGMT